MQLLMELCTQRKHLGGLEVTISNETELERKHLTDIRYETMFAIHVVQIFIGTVHTFTQSAQGKETPKSHTSSAEEDLKSTLSLSNSTDTTRYYIIFQSM